MARWRDQRGFSMAEAVVGIAILAIAVAPLLGLFTSARYAANASGLRTQALTVAREVMSDSLQDYDALSAGTTTGTSGQFNWTREVTAAWKAWNVVVTVEWQERGSTFNVELGSMIADRRRAGE